MAIEEIETEVTGNHRNRLELSALKTISGNIADRLPHLDRQSEFAERRIAGIPTDRGDEYHRERVKDVREEVFRDAFATVAILPNAKGIAEAQRNFYNPQAKLETAKLHADPGVNATMILAEQGENRNVDAPGLVRRAEVAAAEGNFAKARLILGEATARGDRLRHDFRSAIEEIIGGMKVEAPELEVIDQLERNTFEMFERLNQIRYGARRFTMQQLSEMDQESFERVRRQQDRAGVRQ